MKKFEKRIGIKQVDAEAVILKGTKIYSLDEPIPRSMESVVDGYRLSIDGRVHNIFVEKNEFEKAYPYKDMGEVSDGYHTFDELYEFRRIYNAAFFNELARNTDIPICKSKRHNDGEECFGGGWFIVMAELPTGQISNHYELKHWDMFKVPEAEIAFPWDGHTPKDVIERITKYLTI